MDDKTQTATFAGGCFWCTEAIFQRLKGVVSVTPGYAGGTKENPTMNEVYAGNTGHAESIQIVFDPKEISYQQLLDVFFHLHDPTTISRQGWDVGDEYRSVIFYHDSTQKQEAEKAIADLEASHMYSGKIVTQLAPFTKFYPADENQKDYYNKNSYQPYCQVIIDPKIQKLYKDYRQWVKPEKRPT